MSKNHIMKNEYLELLIDNHPDPMIISDLNGTILAINDKLAAIFGKNKEDLIHYYFGLGMYIRNAFGLWRGNKALLDDCSKGEQVHPDTVSMIIIEALWEDLRKN